MAGVGIGEGVGCVGEGGGGGTEDVEGSVWVVKRVKKSGGMDARWVEEFFE